MSRSQSLFSVAGSLALVASVAMGLTACSPSSTPVPATPTSSGACSGSSGVAVIVNYDLLAGGDVAACSPLASGKETVAVALKTTGIATEGTVKYGDQVVCRVNGLPAADKPFTVPGHAAYTENCKDMAPEYAYWALWIKHPGGNWDYAAEGVGTQQVKPGDSVGLVFTTGGKTPTPVVAH